MEWKDVLPVLVGGLVILVVALVVKPALLGEPIGFASSGSVPAGDPPVYVPPAPVPTATPFPDDGEAYTRSFRWTAIDGGVRTTEVRVPEALFLTHRGTSRFSDYNSWGRYALADADRPLLEDLAHRIAPPAANPDEGYFRLMNLVFFVQQIPYDRDDNTTSYIEGVLPSHAMYVKDGVEYPKYSVETLVDGRGDCEDAAILMGGLLDALGYDTVLLRYSDHMALGIRMNEFNPYYAKYTPRHFMYGGQHYYYVEGTDFDWGNISVGSTAIWGRPHPIGDTSGTGIPSVQSETPQIIPLRYVPEPGEYQIRPVRLPAGGA
ncbi:hypothetical protein HL657_01120 [Methanoculleus sp. YWC-01]|jgi:hypothetical protein|uniref:Transglutaminase domain-containing protein n=1 Tax=Methanoculleus nereidis TaxID=2735141 RepID=A0ABU3YZ09_9EURY|nr:hypothetical protein [Methanoculleus sp. YWC-01]MCK9297922.1 hypothetical protein [Methanoculleus sp.]MDV4341797.1 hypothetical protein [Methanoculleus sp. YWC-01]PKL55878.1 MAG: hypothetical protein CVV35_07570 [Methanomicrobiales archaeon HGW-Methanomicrobiales-6]